MAEALAEGRPVAATIPRPRPGGGERLLQTRAIPLVEGPDRVGWVLLFDDDGPAPENADGPVEFHGMVTRDPAMKRMFRIIERAARSEANLLVRGETGAGKELVANAVHALSPRRDGPFRAINCAALPANLLESELFGHVRGAFTGAVRDHPGHFKLANRGTLFLDEVAELPLDLQAKLLRVLETHSVIPVGGRDPVPIDARIVAATHRALRREVEAGRFRADLMYRLRVVPIFLPPLRAREGDVWLLTQRFIEERNLRGERKIERVSPGARALIERHPFPGNVRELKNIVEYAFVVGEGPVLVEADLPPELTGAGDAPEDEAPRANVPPVLPAASPEAARILRVLERAGGSRDRAASMLGISRVTLWRRMTALGLVPPRD
jgi:transcriptional regulator with PAS, ATPase and Fis domain